MEFFFLLTLFIYTFLDCGFCETEIEKLTSSSDLRHSEEMGEREMTFSGRCDMMHPCSQQCVDLPYMFAFKCACYDGKVLAKNGFLCVDRGALLEEDSIPLDEKPMDGIIFIDEIPPDKLRPTKLLPPKIVGETNGGEGENYVGSGSYGSGHSENSTDYIDDEDYSVYASGSGDPDFTFEPEEEGSVPLVRTPEVIRFTPTPEEVVTTTEPTTTTVQMRLTESLSAIVTTPAETPKMPFLTTAESIVSCEDVTCVNGGRCTLDRRKSALCRCPLGFYGSTCEQAIEVIYPSFDSYGYLSLPTPSGMYHSFDIRIDFKATDPDGIIFFNSEHTVHAGIGDFISLALSEGIVQFRFNCGSGTGLIQSTSPITLNEWHVVKVRREDWKAWLRVDEEEPVYGRSKGSYTKLSLRQPFYLGGHPLVSHIYSKTEQRKGMEGCVERLIINTKNVDLSPAPMGEAEGGVNVGECTLPLCQESPCMHGGSCSVIRPDRHVCLCPLGRHGDTCQEEILVDIPSFTGTSYIAHGSLSNKHLSFIEVEVVFRPREPDGVIVYSGLNIDGTGDFIAITLKDGHVEFRFDCGSGPAILRSTLPVEMDVWHAVTAARTAREGILRVNDHPPVQGFSRGAYTQITFKTDLYIGGVHSIDEIPKNAEISSSFVGDIQRVVISDEPLDLVGQALRGINVANAAHPCAGDPCLNEGECEPLHDSFTCHCKLGYSGPNCADGVTLPIRVPQFLFTSYLRYTGPWVMSRISGTETHMRLQFRTLGSTGLLLWAGQSNHTHHRRDFLSLSIEEGILKYSFNLGHGLTILTGKTTVNDGSWHKVELSRIQAIARMEIDDSEVVETTAVGSMRSLDINDALYIGGVRNIMSTTGKRFSQGIAGCVRDITIDGELLSLFEEPADGRNVIECIQDIVGHEEGLQGHG